MGVFTTTCIDCGVTYHWYSFNMVTLHREIRCDACWVKQGTHHETCTVEERETPLQVETP